VAYGASDGSIGLLKIIQSLELTESISAFGPEYTINTQLEDQSQKAFNPDTRGITALAWITSGENVNTIYIYYCPSILYCAKTYTNFRSFSLVASREWSTYGPKIPGRWAGRDLAQCACKLKSSLLGPPHCSRCQGCITFDRKTHSLSPFSMVHFM
jgi:hypothetical protein